RGRGAEVSHPLAQDRQDRGQAEWRRPAGEALLPPQPRRQRRAVARTPRGSGERREIRNPKHEARNNSQIGSHKTTKYTKHTKRREMRPRIEHGSNTDSFRVPSVFHPWLSLVFRVFRVFRGLLEVCVVFAFRIASHAWPSFSCALVEASLS